MSFIFFEILILSLIATKVESKDNFRAKVHTGKEVKTTNSSTLGVSLIQCQNMCVLARRKGTSNICGYDKVSKTCFYSFDTEYDILSTSEVTKVVLIPVEDACQSSEYLVNGMEPVSDDQITASSVVQFNCPNHVIGVAMQGRPISTDPNSIVGVGCCYQRVTAYKLLYSGDCVSYLTIRDSSGSDVILDGNTDQETVVTSMLPSPVTALCVRINPVTWFGGHISLRFDILGCSMNEQQHT
ncbi:CPXM2-like protein [Mya arenaria]|uniref:CPXM2-like protein n=1 Tax=Mya arenaria TaxID=6604 RepID=A0ABY7EKG2_MYAAR|nr:CPXM2-like protein [Mya arenaria]